MLASGEIIHSGITVRDTPFKKIMGSDPDILKAAAPHLNAWQAEQEVKLSSGLKFNARDRIEHKGHEATVTRYLTAVEADGGAQT